MVAFKQPKGGGEINQNTELHLLFSNNSEDIWETFTNVGFIICMFWKCQHQTLDRSTIFVGVFFIGNISESVFLMFPI